MLIITLPIYQRQIVVFDKLKEFKGYCLTQLGDLPDHLPKLTGGTCYSSSKGYPTLIFLGDKSPSTVAHECLHAVHALMDSIGQDPDVVNDEFQAYLLGYLVNAIHANFRIKRPVNDPWLSAFNDQFTVEELCALEKNE